MGRSSELVSTCSESFRGTIGVSGSYGKIGMNIYSFDIEVEVSLCKIYKCSIEVGSSKLPIQVCRSV